ncbi:hypothetical protein GWK47_050285 [Chionoecetes opilio]|uniref:Uncharacterized protein n=1 Tax=Chionoecetes opilio TaxID=41210 RepID=A0A8J4YAY7_CHIOP|nr:hypothetical protein GWK47_050285 [Chionoecetes opilio]
MELTRGNNILDLIISNSYDYLHSYDIEKTVMSDHNLIHARANIRNIPTKNTTTSGRIDSFHALNFYGRNIDWDKVRKELDAIKWENIFSGMEAHEMYEVLSSKCLQICKEHIPLRRSSGRKHQIPRDRRILMKKRANLKRKLKKVTYAVAENAIQRQLHLLEDALAQSHVRQREQEEQRAVENIKVNSKFFYSYAKKRLTSTTSVGPLMKENGELEDGPQEMAEMLQTEYQRVFSKLILRNG